MVLFFISFIDLAYMHHIFFKIITVDSPVSDLSPMVKNGLWREEKECSDLMAL